MLQPDFCICFAPRSGSTLLSHLISSTAYFSYPDEIYDGVDVEEILKKMQKSYLNGISISFAHFHYIKNIIDLKEVKCIWLRRLNKVEQAISLTKAYMTNEWVKKSDVTSKDSSNLHFSNDRISSEISHLVAQDVLWGEYFVRHSIDPLMIFYEEFQHEEDYLSIVNKIADFMGIPDEIFYVETPTQVQRDEDSIARYYEFLKSFDSLQKSNS